MRVNKILLTSNVSKSQIEKTETHYKIKGIPITVDGATMNNTLYPADENAKGMDSMVNKPLTIGHPIDDKGNYLSGREGKGLQDHYSGGHITKTYNMSGVWYADAEIKTSILKSQNNGDELIKILDNKSDLPVSTGLMFECNDISGTNSKGEKYERIAINQSYDHLAALLNEAPAGGKDTIARFNSEEIQKFCVNDLITGDNKEISSLKAAYNALKAKLDTFIAKGYNETDLNINVNEKEGSEMTPEEIKAAIAEAVTANAESNKQALVAAVNSAVAPLQEKIATMQESITANADKEKAALVADVVALDIGIDEELAKTMSVNSLNSVIAKNSGKPAGGVTTNGKRGKEEEYDAFAMPEFKVKGAE